MTTPEKSTVVANLTPQEILQWEQESFKALADVRRPLMFRQSLNDLLGAINADLEVGLTQAGHDALARLRSEISSPTA